MPYNGSGGWTFTANYPFVTGTVISSTAMNNLINDMANNGLAKVVTVDGQSTTTSRIPFAAGIGVTNDITTPSTTFAVANTTATTVNAFGAATTLNVGAASVTVTLGGATALVSAPGGQIKFPATPNPSANANTMDGYAEDTFTGTLTGVTTVITDGFYYTKIGNEVTVWNAIGLSGVSNSTAKTITGMPAVIRPSRNTVVFGIFASDNGGASVASRCDLTSNGVFTLYATPASATWTGSGTATIQPFSVSYTTA